MSGEQLTGVYRNHAGEAISFLTSEGRVISYRKALAEIEGGSLATANLSENELTSSEIDLSSVHNLPEVY
ncbi:hypothetical protein M3182_23460 [Mesobacillus maritimus]|uniref:hypothetical protein n=1 Tax=Mesobacillus maritimus TaxID=1643336 RepID=UPI002041C14A|nr:hypothetical protein [Mesobacillus maritimus]MCM3588637.1 hypothetical protein [Mesobacillus maritimus]MCM3671840.1 hypothetical protein [Mesobacillus maritimus]